MDWRRVVAEVEHIQTLDQETATAYLAALSPDAPDIADQVRRLAQRAGLSTSFMATSVHAPSIDPEPLDVGDQVGAWRVTAFVGAGGMGAVYRAERADGLYEQVVALKVMHGSIGGARTAAFDRERQRLARLDHPGVSRIIDGGATADGRPFMAIEFIDGSPIDAFCRAHALPTAARIGLMASLCDATAHAHARLVLHRDIKAGNVLVDASGQVKLVDFGIASLLDDEAEAGVGPLTIATAAPEQLRGEPVSAATDVFALGLLAHQLITGDPPPRGADGGVVIDPSRINDKECFSILAHATAAAPDDRYSSASALGDDLRRMLAHQTVSVHPGGAAYRARKFMRRYPLASGFAALAAAALTLGLAASAALTVQAERARERAQMEAARANEARRLAEQETTRARRAAAVESAYVGLLNRLFAQRDDEAQFTALFKARADEAMAQWRTDPDRAATALYAVGRSFVDRSDFLAAREVLEPWIAAGFGDAALLREAKSELALTYEQLGDYDAALALYREAEAEYANSADALSNAHLETLSAIANITLQPGELTRARDLITQALQADPGPDVESAVYLIDLRRLLNMRLGDFEAAYDDIARLIAVYQDNPLVYYGRVSAYGNYVTFCIYYKRDFDKALEAIDVLIADATTLGPASLISDAIYFKSEVALFQGDMAEAVRLVREAEEIKGDYVDVDVALVATRMEALAANGDFDGAQAALETLEAIFDPDGVGAPLHPRVTLSKAFYLALRDGPAAGGAVLAEQDFTRSAASPSIVGTFRLERLEAMGVEPAPEGGAEEGASAP